MGEYWIGEIINGKPPIFWMNIFFEIFRASYPRITEIEDKISFPVYIFRVDNNLSGDINFIDMYSGFFEKFSLGCFEKCFPRFLFSSGKSPIAWPVF